MSRRTELLRIGEVTIERWEPAYVDAVRAWIHPHAEWKDWDAPYFQVPDPDSVALMAQRLLDDPWQRDGRTDLPKRLAVVVDGVAVGSVSWHWEDPTSGWARAGVVLYDPATWGRGLGRVAFGAWLDWLGSRPEVHRVDIATWSGNERMVRLARALGLVEEARHRDARIVRGQRYDALVMARLTPSP